MLSQAPHGPAQSPGLRGVGAGGLLPTSAATSLALATPGSALSRWRPEAGAPWPGHRALPATGLLARVCDAQSPQLPTHAADAGARYLVPLGFPGGASGKEPTCQCRRCKRRRIVQSLEEGMATHPCILAWRIPWTEEPGGLLSIGLQNVGLK